MAGGRTYLHGTHLSSIGEIVEPVSIKLVESEIEKALGRKLTAAEQSEIETKLELYRGLHLEHEQPAVTAQHIKKTLAGISKLSGEEAKASYTDCDSKSEAQILKALYDLGARDKIFNPPGDLISKAASRALENLSIESGAPAKVYQEWLADYVVECWQALGGGDSKAHAKDNREMSPLVRFGVALFSSVKNDKVDATGVVKLLRAAQKRRASTR